MQLAQDGLLNQTDARLLYELGERVRTLLQSYFRSPSELFVSFTHLVCRSAVAGTSGTAIKDIQTYLLFCEPEWFKFLCFQATRRGDWTCPILSTWTTVS